MLFSRGRRTLILTLLSASTAMTLSSANATGADTEMRLEAAIQREVVLGDLKGAMSGYQAVIRETANNATFSRALYRYARCLEKLERRTEAYEVYARVVKEFSDQPEAALTRAWLATWEYSVAAPANLTFEQGAIGKLPDAWFVPVAPNGVLGKLPYAWFVPSNDVDHWAQRRRDGCMNHDSCAVVLVPENEPVRAGNLMQSFKASAYRGKTVRLSAWLRLDPTVPEDRGQMWLSVDRSGDKKGFFDDMSERPIRAPEWTYREIRARVDLDATFISSASCRLEEDASGSIACRLKSSPRQESALHKSNNKAIDGVTSRTIRLSSAWVKRAPSVCEVTAR